MEKIKDTLKNLIDAAISGDVLGGQASSFLSIMAKSNPHIRQDIPAAFEMYTLLAHFLDKLPMQMAVLDIGESEVKLLPSILCDDKTGRILALLPVRQNELTNIAYWITDGIHSNKVKQLAGILVMPFSRETHDSIEHLLPEWFAAFYVDGLSSHCVPILTLKSIMEDTRFGGDWVDVALARMESFCLPCKQAAGAIKTETEQGTT